jgi:uncharacterized protein YcbK (DUF882 family)
MRLTENFELSEFASRDGAETPADVIENLKEVAKNLEIIRANLRAPIRINSGYRSPAHNKRIGGATNSFHVKGLAADIVVDGYTPEEVFATLEILMRSGKIKKGGLKRYRTFVHYDIRGVIKRW